MAPTKRRSARLSASHLMKKACKICQAPTLICGVNPEKPGEVDGKSYVWPKCKCALTQKASKAAKAKIKPLKRVKKAAKVNKTKLSASRNRTHSISVTEVDDEFDDNDVEFGAMDTQPQLTSTPPPSPQQSGDQVTLPTEEEALLADFDEELEEALEEAAGAQMANAPGTQVESEPDISEMPELSIFEQPEIVTGNDVLLSQATPWHEQLNDQDDYPFPEVKWIEDNTAKNWRDHRLVEIRDKFERKKVKIGRAGLSMIGPDRAKVIFEATHGSKNMVYAWFCATRPGQVNLYALTIITNHPDGEVKCVWETASSRQLREDKSKEHWSYGIEGGYIDEHGRQVEGYGCVEDARDLPFEAPEQGDSSIPTEPMSSGHSTQDMSCNWPLDGDEQDSADQVNDTILDESHPLLNIEATKNVTQVAMARPGQIFDEKAVYNCQGEFQGVIFDSADAPGEVTLYKVNDFWPRELDCGLVTHANLLAKEQVVYDFSIKGKLTEPQGWEYDDNGLVILPGPRAKPVFVFEGGVANEEDGQGGVPTEAVTPSLATERNQPILEQWEAAKDDFMNLVENVSQFNISDIRSGMLNAMQETDDAFLATDENEELHEVPTDMLRFWRSVLSGATQAKIERGGI